MEHLKSLKMTQPEEWTNTKLSQSFGISVSAVVRILRSNFEPPQEVKDRQDQKAKEQTIERHAMFKKKLFQSFVDSKTAGESKVAKKFAEGRKSDGSKSQVKTVPVDRTSARAHDKTTTAEGKAATRSRSRVRTTATTDEERVTSWESDQGDHARTAQGDGRARTKAKVDTADKTSVRGNSTIRDRLRRSEDEDKSWIEGNKSYVGETRSRNNRTAAKSSSQAKPDVNSRNSDHDGNRIQHLKNNKTRVKRSHQERSGALTDVPREEKMVPMETNKRGLKSRRAGSRCEDVGPRPKVEVGFARKSLHPSEDSKTWTSFKSRKASSRISSVLKRRSLSNKSKNAETEVATDVTSQEANV